MAVPRIVDTSGSALHAAAVTPSDTTDLTTNARGLLIATAGNLKVTMVGGEEITLPVQAGYNPLQVSRVWAAGKTCGDVYALW
jgi:hypothetical protein